SAERLEVERAPSLVRDRATNIRAPRGRVARFAAVIGACALQRWAIAATCASVAGLAPFAASAEEALVLVIEHLPDGLEAEQTRRAVAAELGVPVVLGGKADAQR